MSTEDKRKVREADELARTGQQYMKQKPADYSQAIECYTQAISLNPTVAKFFFMRGQCYKNKNQHQKCLSDYTMALRIEPKDKSYLEARGTCHRRLNMPAEAVKDYTAAIALDDKQANYFQCAALIASICLQGNFRNIVCMYRALAYCAMMPPEYNSALADLELSYNLSENKFKAMLQVAFKYFSYCFLFNRIQRARQRGFVKRRVGRAEEAVEDLRRALSLDAKNREAHNHLGMALLDAGHLEQVHLLISNNSPRSILIYIRICQALDAFVNAAEFSDSAFNPNLSNNKALVLFRLGRQEEALASFLEALSSASSPEAAFFYNRGASAPHRYIPNHVTLATQARYTSSWRTGLQQHVTSSLPSVSMPSCRYFTTLSQSRWNA
jgi:tetratricopeptide (TPR) repeat protein